MIPLTVKVAGLTHMPQSSIYTRLGRRAHVPAIPSASADALIQRFVGETKVRIFYCERPLHIYQENAEIGDYRFHSRMVTERFAQAIGVLAAGASALPEDFARIGALQQAGDLASAVILDAVLAEKVDFALEFITQDVAVDLRRAGRRTGMRLSCGYGDFSLEHQDFFYALLDFKRYGIGINERHILSPEKTVTALLPIYAVLPHPDTSAADAGQGGT